MVSTSVILYISLHGLLLIYRSPRDGRLSKPSLLVHSGHFTPHKVVTCQPQIGRRAEKVRWSAWDRHPNDWATPLTYSWARRWLMWLRGPMYKLKQC